MKREGKRVGIKTRPILWGTQNGNNLIEYFFLFHCTIYIDLLWLAFGPHLYLTSKTGGWGADGKDGRMQNKNNFIASYCEWIWCFDGAFKRCFLLYATHRPPLPLPKKKNRLRKRKWMMNKWYKSMQKRKTGNPNMNEKMHRRIGQH